MSKVLIVAEHLGGKLNAATAKCVSAAQALSPEAIDILVLAADPASVAAEAALGLLGAMPLRDLNLAILLGDVNALSRAPGIGKKTAQRIALELKDKVTQADINQPTGKAATPTSGAAADNFAEAIEALTALGYSAIEARDALSHVEDKDAPADELIRLALRAMAGM